MSDQRAIGRVLHCLWVLADGVHGPADESANRLEVDAFAWSDTAELGELSVWESRGSNLVAGARLQF